MVILSWQDGDSNDSVSYLLHVAFLFFSMVSMRNRMMAVFGWLGSMIVVRHGSVFQLCQLKLEYIWGDMRWKYAHQCNKKSCFHHYILCTPWLNLILPQISLYVCWFATDVWFDWVMFCHKPVYMLICHRCTIWLSRILLQTSKYVDLLQIYGWTKSCFTASQPLHLFVANVVFDLITFYHKLA